MIGYYLARLLRKLRPRAIGASVIHKKSRIGPGAQVLFSRVDRYSYCGADCVLLSVDIGAFCSIADNVIIGAPQHAMSSVSSSPIFHLGRNAFGASWAAHSAPETSRTRIGNDVWIGNGAKIRGGISIGNGAVIGTGAVVTKDVEPYAVVAGVPAKLIKYRFNESVRRRLEDTRWWDWPEEKLKAASGDFYDPVRFLETIE